MTNYEADQHVQELNDLRTLQIPVPTLVGYRILQNLHNLKSVLQPYYDAVDDAVRRHSGGRERIDKEDDPEAYAECVQAIAALRQVEIDVDIYSIKIEALGTGELPISALFALDFMLGKE